MKTLKEQSLLIAVEMAAIFAVCAVFSGGCAAAGFHAGSAGGADKKEQSAELRITIDVRDGSRLIGMARQDSLPVQCSLGSIKIPLADIRKVTMFEDREQATICLANGDKLTGVPGWRAVKVTTIIGDIAVTMTEIRELTVVPVFSGSAANRGLVLYYPFDLDEGGKVTDASGGRHDGIVNDAKWTSAGRIGGAYDFSGSGTPYISFDPGDLAGTRALSVAAWIRNFGDPGDWEYVIKCGYDGGVDADNRIMFIFLGFQKTGVSPGNICGSTLGIQRDSDGVLASQTVYLNKPLSYFRDGNWHHVAMTWDGTTATWYVEGQFNSQATTSAGCLAHSAGQRLLIGNGYSFGSIHENFNGLIDEVMIYNRALSGEEVGALYARGADRGGSVKQ